MAKSKSTPSSLRDKAKRAQLSCYTCRQRKVKCDRVKPCSSCVQYQDPDGCRYDISDDKRQPMLMADAYKQLRRENSELKAKEEDNQAMITEYKTENAALKARLAAFQIRNLQSPNYSTFSNPQTQLENRSTLCTSIDVYPDSSKNTYEVGKTMSVHSKSMDTFGKSADNSVLQNPLISWDTDRLRWEDCHGSTLSQALKMANVIVFNVRKVQEPSNLLLQQSARDLIMVLGNLPNEFPFSLPEKAKGREMPYEMISSHAILVSQTLHSHIITLLSCLGNRSSRQSDERSICLTEPLRQQLITSCFVMLALSQYLDAQPNKYFFDPGICRQSRAALAAISQFDPAVEEDPLQIPSKQTVAMLCKQEIPKLATPLADTCTRTFQGLNHQRSSQRTKLHKGSLSSSTAGITAIESMEHVEQAPLGRNAEEDCSISWFAKTEPPSISQRSLTKEFPLSGSNICHASIPANPELGNTDRQTRMQGYGLYSANYSPATIGHELRHDDVPQISQTTIFPVGDDTKIFSNNYQNMMTHYSLGSSGNLVWRVPTDQHGASPGRGTNGMGISLPPQLLNPIAYSTDVIPYTMDDSYTPSVNTSSSSLQTPIQSNSVSPVPMQEQLDTFGSKSRTLDLMQQAFDNDRGFTNGDHE